MDNDQWSLKEQIQDLSFFSIWVCWRWLIVRMDLAVQSPHVSISRSGDSRKRITGHAQSNQDSQKTSRHGEDARGRVESSVK